MSYKKPFEENFKGLFCVLRVFEKTGSLQKLQQVMGHSDMKVSLTYLRGLEVKQLDVEDLPEL